MIARHRRIEQTAPRLAPLSTVLRCVRCTHPRRAHKYAGSWKWAACLVESCDCMKYRDPKAKVSA